ncbi:MAG: hypothetical protein ACE14P_14975 [Methanotrichaceae archaeon]
MALALISVSTLAWAEGYTIKTTSNKFLGTYLVNQSGFTLYYLQNDSKVLGASTCYGECAALWHPFYAQDVSLSDDLDSMDFGVITRTDGSKQTTFKNWPLYLYGKDKFPGDTKGNGVDGVWHIVYPADQSQPI